MSAQGPRRPSSSRTSTRKPRKLAGQGVGETDPSDLRGSVTREETESTRKETSARQPDGRQDEPAEARPSMFAGARLTRVLLGVLAVICVLLLLQGVWFAVHAARSGDHPKPKAGEILVPAGRPILLSQADINEGVDQAAKDAVTAVSLRYQSYDDDVAKAADLMTDKFGTQFRNTAADAKPSRVKGKVDVTAKVLYQGVVRANRTQLQALLFLNQWVTKGSGKDRRVTLTPYRLLVTMVHTNTGWLVDGLDLK